MYLKVKGNEELVRDTSSSAILNTDNEALKAYKARRQREAAIDMVVKEHAEIKSDIQEIKNLLRELLGQK